jgi:hypothetical protein
MLCPLELTLHDHTMAIAQKDFHGFKTLTRSCTVHPTGRKRVTFCC